MTDGTLDFMGYSHQQFRLTAPVGEAVSKWLKARYPAKTAQNVAADTGCDPKTAENIVAGHISSVSFTRLCKAYGWPFLAAVGAAVIGETYETSITREIEDIAHERRDLEARETRLRGAYARVRARRSVEPSGLRLVHEDADRPRREGRTQA